jgi:hypothetical protein
MKEASANLTLGRRPLLTWVFVANITDEFILGLDVLQSHDASTDLRRHVLQLGDEEVPLWRPGVRAHSSPYMKANSEMAETRYGTVAIVRLEGHMEVVDSLSGTCSRAAHRGEARRLIKHPREVPITITGDHQPQKHTRKWRPQEDADAQDEKP